MELKRGHKNTDIGIIPEDWQVFALRQVVNAIGDVDHYMPRTTEVGIPYIMTGDLKELSSQINFGTCKKIDVADYKKLSKKIRSLKGDVVLARYATIGIVSYVDVDYDFVVSYSCVTIKSNPTKLLGKYLYYYFKSNAFSLEAGNIINSNTQSNIGISDLYTLKIGIPNFQEQQAIATALSDTDALISGLEKLIAKKRNIKQGAMQELLKPKKGWEVKRLGDLVSVYSGGTPNTNNSNYYNGDISWITSGDLNLNVIYYVQGKISKEGLENSSAKMVNEDTLLIALYGATAITKIRAAINQAVLAIVPKNSDTNFLYYKISSLKEWIIKTYTQGGQPNLSGNIIKSIEFDIPIDRKEQVRIANILLEMDAEIGALDSKLQKYRDVKSGMMQNLLTGKIRLV